MQDMQIPLDLFIRPVLSLRKKQYMPVPQREIIGGLMEGESLLGYPAFTWTDGNQYICIPSISEFERELETGGFYTAQMLTMTVRILDEYFNPIFPNGILPDTQQRITYQGKPYRIIITKPHPTGCYMRIIAESPQRGI
jgi:hypothetical protein